MIVRGTTLATTTLFCAGLVACKANTDLPELDIVIDVTLSEQIPTVGTAEWTRMEDEAIETWLEFGVEGTYTLETPERIPNGDALRAQLLGMKPTTEYSVRAVMRYADDRIQYGIENRFTTGEAPPNVPRYSAEWYDESAVDPGFILTTHLLDPPMVVIIDMDGDVVWWHQSVDQPVGRAQLSRDGRGIYYQRLNVEGLIQHRLHYVGLDGTNEDFWFVNRGHHDFVELPNGKVAILVHDVRTPLGSDEEVIGDQIVELSLDGTVEVVYSTWDDLEYLGSTPQTQGTGWTHANALQYDEASDAYLISFKTQDSIHKIDRSTGERIWALGGPESDFHFADGNSVLFESQHQFQLLEESILVFVNGDEVDDLDSMAVEYSFDETNPIVERIWSYENDPGFFCFSLGDVQRLENSNTHINWSVQGQLDEVSPDGELLWRLTSDLGSVFGYSERLNSIYTDL